ncbi:MAG: hypothetical protein H0W70_15830 [Actinobacteria bacterium]|nr:hypothetical protein [Actinomycetota bacterium]
MNPLVSALVSLVAVATTVSPFGLYHHVPASDLDKPAVRSELSAFRLVTLRGEAGVTTGAVGQFLEKRGNATVFLYRRGTAVSGEEAASLAAAHPDWLARDAGGTVVTSNAGGQVIDITNPAVRKWLVAGVATDVAKGKYDGVYLDVLGAFFSSRFYSARPVVAGEPLADSAWRDASVALIRGVKQATGKPVVANGFGIQNGKNYADHKADADQLIAAADGIQIEQFVRNGNMALDKYKRTNRWRQDVEFLGDVGRLGKIVLADTRVRAAADAVAVDRQREYALASFLVGAHGPARFRFAEGAATGKVDTDDAAVIAGLGRPLADAKRAGEGFTRAFAHGSVSVDPATHDARIVVGRNTVTTAPPPREGVTKFYVVGVAAAVLVIGGVVFGGRHRLRRRRD